MTFRLPHLLDQRYRLIRPLGEGGFAETFLAIDTVDDRPVAVKVLRDQFAGDDDMAARFAREARAAASIEHPNVVSIYDHGEDAGHVFTVMEYVDGPNLKQELRQNGPLPLAEALRIIDGVLAGLAAVHAAGIVHRDVKPENILLSTARQPKLTDFGIARGAASTGLTATGVTLGTATYMAPEQATGGELGPATDIYAAGVVLFELLTGQVPFPGDNPLQVMFQHVHESPPRPTELNPEIPPAVSAVVLRALAKDPARRYASAEAMRQALTTSVTEQTPQAGETSPALLTAPVLAVRPSNRLPITRPRRLVGRVRLGAAAVLAVLFLALASLAMLGFGGGDTAANDALAQPDSPRFGAAATIEPTSSPAALPSPTPTTAATRASEPASTPSPEPESEPEPEPEPEIEPQLAVQQVESEQPTSEEPTAIPSQALTGTDPPAGQSSTTQERAAPRDVDDRDDDGAKENDDRGKNDDKGAAKDDEQQRDDDTANHGGEKKTDASSKGNDDKDKEKGRGRR